jgi:Galactose oxidase, central domain
MVGFGLGGLVVLVLVGVAGGLIELPGQHPAGATLVSHSPSAEPPPSADPSPLAVPSPSMSPSPDATLVSPSPSVLATGPGARAGAALVYDPENHGVLLFGGATSSTTLGDTWLWDGKSWRKLDVLGPPARSAAMVAYDSARHVVVLFGGSGPAGIGQGLYFQDTWTWDGTQWQLQAPAHMPNPRMRAGMVFDERRGVTVMFGGEGETATHTVATYTATWTWDGVDWTLLDTTVTPQARHFFGMAYDTARGVTVLFGGSFGGARFNDTWTWNGTSWTQQPIQGPSAHGWTQLAYDAATKNVVGYVYYASDNQPLAEYTIVWDGTKWTDITGAQDPTPRAEVRMTYDPATNQVVLYGPTAETWTWNGAAWSVWGPA